MINRNQEISPDLPGKLIFEIEAQNKENSAKEIKNKIELEIE